MTRIIWLFVFVIHTFPIRSEAVARGHRPEGHRDEHIHANRNRQPHMWAMRKIVKGLSAMLEVSDLFADREHQLVQFTGAAWLRDAVVQKLRTMGYPEKAMRESM